MSRLSKFMGKPKEIVIEGEKFLIHPLKGKQLHLFMKEEATPKERQEMAFEILCLSLKPSEPDVTVEEIKELTVKVLNQLLIVAMEVNGIKDETVDKIKERIIQARSKSK